MSPTYNSHSENRYIVVVPLEHRQKYLADVFLVPGVRYFPAVRLVCHLLQSLAPDKVVIEVDERPVAQLVWGHVVVFNVIGVEAATQRPALAFIAVGG